MDALEWWQTVYPRLGALGVEYREVMQEAGDMIYVPAGGWYHQVREWMNHCECIHLVFLD